MASKFEEASPSTAWFKAIENGKCDEVMRLLEGEARLLRQTGSKNRTALHKAVIECCAELVRLVLRLVHTSPSNNAGDLSLGDLLEAVDGSCGQTALAIAIVIGNTKIVNTLNNAARSSPEPNEDSDLERRQQLRELIVQELQEEKFQAHTELLNRLRSPTDENTGEEYVFHRACAFDAIESQEISDILRSILQSIVDRAKEREPELVHFIYELKDRRGMTPLHAAVASDIESNLTLLLGIIPEEDEYNNCVNALDGAGRTPLHRAAAQSGDESNIVPMLVADGRTDLNAVFSPSADKEDYPADYKRAHRSPRTALHLAVVHNKLRCVEALLGADNSRIDLNRTSARFVKFHESGPDQIMYWTPLQIAAFMGHLSVLQMLVENDKAYDHGRYRNKSRSPRIWDKSSVLHIVVWTGNAEALRLILESRQFNPFVTDVTFGKTALHWGTDERVCYHGDVQHYGDLIDYESLRLTWERSSLSRQLKDVSWKGCIILLLQTADIDLWPKDKQGLDPYPGPLASKEVRTWWYEYEATLIRATKKNLTIAANAMAVTAALVATASFLGPLQPPLGIESNASLYYEVLAVRIFIVSDSLSFYLAVASITLSIIPSLPLSQEPPRRELRRHRITVIVALCLLLVSIVCVLVAFAAATIAISPTWSPRMLTLSTTIMGGAPCVAVVMVYLFKSLRLMLHRYEFVKDLYEKYAQV